MLRDPAEPSLTPLRPAGLETIVAGYFDTAAQLPAFTRTHLLTSIQAACGQPPDPE